MRRHRDSHEVHPRVRGDSMHSEYARLCEAYVEAHLQRFGAVDFEHAGQHVELMLHSPSRQGTNMLEIVLSAAKKRNV